MYQSIRKLVAGRAGRNKNVATWRYFPSWNSFWSRVGASNSATRFFPYANRLFLRRRVCLTKRRLILLELVSLTVKNNPTQLFTYTQRKTTFKRLITNLWQIDIVLRHCASHCALYAGNRYIICFSFYHSDICIYHMNCQLYVVRHLIGTIYVYRETLSIIS